MSEPTHEQGPDELRREIARTRTDMDRTLAELEDRVSPTRIRERQTEKVRSSWQRTREAVMGSPSDGPSLTDRASGMAEGAGDAIQDAPHQVEEMARGNPLAAGIVAFGIGALAGSLFPSSRAEQALASELRDEFEEPVRAQLQEAGQEAGQELKQHAEHAVQETKQVAQDAAQHTQQEAQGATEQVRDHASDSAQRVRDRS